MSVPSEFGARRTAIVTGAAKRIGAAIARALAADGWRVVVHCNRSRDAADALARDIGGVVVEADLADPAAAAAIVAAAEGDAALLVNNASLFEYDTLGDFSPELWARHLDVNLRAPTLLIQAFAAALGGGNGLVINLLDAKLAALNPDYFSYTVSKWGLLGVTELASRALAPRVRVCGVAPALTLVSGPQNRDAFEAVHAFNPLGRGVEVGEIVAALRFLVATPTITGQVLTIDAGARLLGLARDVALVERGLA